MYIWVAPKDYVPAGAVKLCQPNQCNLHLFVSSQHICWTCPEGVIFSVWRSAVLPILNLSISCYYIQVCLFVFFNVSILLCYAKNICISEIGISSQLWASILKFMKKYKIQITDYAIVQSHHYITISFCEATLIAANLVIIYGYLADHNSILGS